MPLNEGKLAAAINEALRQSDAASAPSNLREVKGRQTRQRVEMARAIAREVIKHLKENADIVVPDHDPFRTELAPGPGPHAHPITVPLRHKTGRIV